ncbi:MAG: hypothetical protein ACR2RV_03115 [Verrucomicrobiales bacterium]
MKSVKDGKGEFVAPGGKLFTYEVSQLSEGDQSFLKKAMEKHAETLRQLRYDYPWLDLE